MLRAAYSLPDFCRTSWANEATRELWDPIFAKIRRMWSHLEIESVRQGQRDLALMSVRRENLTMFMERYTQEGLQAIDLYNHSERTYISDINKSNSGNAFTVFAVGRDRNAQLAATAFRENRSHELGHMLGYPECCCQFFDEVWNKERYIDTTWPMADRSARIEMPDDCTRETDVNPSTNILLRWLGLRPVYHLPCSLDCKSTERVAQQLKDVAHSCKEGDTMAQLENILSWPVQWSALHGIAEVETPVFRVVTRTDATRKKYVVRLRSGVKGVQAAPPGTRFPFESKPVRHESLVSPRITRALRTVPDEPKMSLAQYHLEFGFRSFGELSSACVPIVDAILNSGARSVFHLGCKNGALLREALRRDPDLQVGGVDPDPQRIVAAQKNMSPHAHRFLCGTLSDPNLLARLPEAGTWVVMVGRLLELPQNEAADVLKVAAAKAGTVVIYAFSDWLKDSSLTALAMRLEIIASDLVIETPGVARVRLRRPG